ncbi:MAG: helix-turn-helix transcriptional regulator [Acidobacteriota bacterium]
MSVKDGIGEDRRSAFEGLPAALRWLRRCQGLTQGEVARSAGIDAAMVSRYERGEAMPQLATLGRLLEGMEASLILLGHALRVVRGEPGENEPLRLSAELPAAEVEALRTTAVVLRKLIRSSRPEEPSQEVALRRHPGMRKKDPAGRDAGK